MTPTGGTRYFRFIPNHETGVSVRPSPGYAGEVAEHILELLLLQITEVWILWEDDDGAAVCPAAPWRHRGRGGYRGVRQASGLVINLLLAFNGPAGSWMDSTDSFC